VQKEKLCGEAGGGVEHYSVWTFPRFTC